MGKFITVFTNRRMLITLMLGFSCGLPLGLTMTTLQAWLTQAKIDVATIGMFALIGYPYALKFLWAPILDMKPLPFLGLRRGWMALSQVGLFAATIGLAFSDPASNLTLFAFMALLIAFFSATQDIVVDAYRIEIIDKEEEIGAAAATYISSYRLAMVVSGGFALVMADNMSWTAVFTIMAILNLVGLATILLSAEPKVIRRKTHGTMKERVFLPFIEFFRRAGGMEILIFVMVYKLSTLMATALMTKFLMDLNYSMTLIGATSKGIGIFATIGGTVVGGSMMAKLGLKRSLWIFGIVQSFVGLSFYFLSIVAAGESAYKELWLIIMICLDNVMMALGTVALSGFMMSVCNKQFTATQYALLSSVMAVSRVVLVAPAGIVVAAVGWNMFFISTVALAIPGLLMLKRFDAWQSAAGEAPSEKLRSFDVGLIALFIGSLLLLSSGPIWQMLDMKTQGANVAMAGGVGVLLLVFVNIVRPYFAGAKNQTKAAS